MASLSLGKEGRPVALCLHELFRGELSPPAHAPPTLVLAHPHPSQLTPSFLPPCSLFPTLISCYHPLPFRTKHKARSSFILFICGTKAEVGWENMGRSSFPSQRAVGLLRALLVHRHSGLGVRGFTSVLGGSLLYVGSLAPALSSCQFWKREPHFVVPPFFLVSPESREPSRWTSLSGKSHWYVRCPIEQLCSGKVRVQSSGSAEVSGEPDQMGSVWWTCLLGGLGGMALQYLGRLGGGEGGAQGSWNSGVEVEVSGAPEVSVPGFTGGHTPLGWWWGFWHLLAWLCLLCLLCIWPGVTGSLLLITASSSHCSHSRLWAWGPDS